MHRESCSFPSCRCEWSKRGEHCPRYGGTTKGQEAPQQPPSEPWGWKVTMHLYGEGEPPPGEAIIEATNHAARYIGADDFAGAETAVVQTRPTDQVAS